MMQEAETRVKRMEDEMLELSKELNKKVEQIRASDVATEKVLDLSFFSTLLGSVFVNLSIYLFLSV